MAPMSETPNALTSGWSGRRRHFSGFKCRGRAAYSCRRRMPLNIRQIINARLTMLTRTSKITHSPARREYPSFAGNGRYIALLPINRAIQHVDSRTGKREKSRACRKLSVCTKISGDQQFRQKNRVFRVREGQKGGSCVRSGRVPETLCEGCLRATDWSRDLENGAGVGGNPCQIDVVDLTSREQSAFSKHPNHHLL